MAGRWQAPSASGRRNWGTSRWSPNISDVSLDGLLVFRVHPEMFGDEIFRYRAAPLRWGVVVFTIERYGPAADRGEVHR